MRIFIEMLEFLCYFGKNVVNNDIKMKKYFTTHVALDSLLLRTAAHRAILSLRPLFYRVFHKFGRACLDTTVKLGYNYHGCNKYTVTTNKITYLVWLSIFYQNNFTDMAYNFYKFHRYNILFFEKHHQN